MCQDTRFVLLDVFEVGFSHINKYCGQSRGLAGLGRRRLGNKGYFCKNPED